MNPSCNRKRRAGNPPPTAGAPALDPTFVDWGTLLETGERGVYQAAPARPVQDKQLVVWLTEAALLTSRVPTGVLTTLTQTPVLFPFHLASLYAVDLAGHSRLEPFCHGLNEDIVRFREYGRR